MRRLRAHQRGLGLISSIFLITVVALLTVAITRTVRTSGDSMAIDMLSARAFWSAESGAQLGVRAAMPVSGPTSCGTQNLDFQPLGYGQCEATVTCAASVVAGETYYQVESQGRCSAGAGLEAIRHVRVVVRQ